GRRRHAVALQPVERRLGDVVRQHLLAALHREVAAHRFAHRSQADESDHAPPLPRLTTKASERSRKALTSALMRRGWSTSMLCAPSHTYTRYARRRLCFRSWTLGVVMMRSSVPCRMSVAWAISPSRPTSSASRPSSAP